MHLHCFLTLFQNKKKGGKPLAWLKKRMSMSGTKKAAATVETKDIDADDKAEAAAASESDKDVPTDVRLNECSSPVIVTQ